MYFKVLQWYMYLTKRTMLKTTTWINLLTTKYHHPAHMSMNQRLLHKNKLLQNIVSYIFVYIKHTHICTIYKINLHRIITGNPNSCGGHNTRVYKYLVWQLWHEQVNRWRKAVVHCNDVKHKRQNIDWYVII